MKFLITGGQGFIGSALVNRLVMSGAHRVTIFDRHQRNIDFGHPVLNVDFYLGDIRDQNAVEDAISQHDGVFHLAALLGTSETVRAPRESIDTNIQGAINVFEGCRIHKKPCVQIATASFKWNNTYAITKHCSERFAFMYNKEFGTKIAVVQAANVYGPYQKARPVRKAVPSFITRALRGDPIEIFFDGSQILDLIYIDDVAEILVRAMTMDHGLHDFLFEAGTGESITAIQLAVLIKKACESKSEIRYLPSRAGEPPHSLTKADPSTLAPLNWKQSDFTPLEEGIQKTVEWYRKNPFYVEPLQNVDRYANIPK
jgi:UDP-glucose 4-epimerase